MGTKGIGNGLDDPALDPVWEAIEIAGLIVFLHPHYGVDAKAYGEQENGHVLPLALGFPFETTIVCFSEFYLGTSTKLFDRRQRGSFYQVFLTASPTSVSCSPIPVVHYHSCLRVLHRASITTLLLLLVWNMMHVSILESFTSMQLPMVQKNLASSVIRLRARHVMNKIPSSKRN